MRGKSFRLYRCRNYSACTHSIMSDVVLLSQSHHAYCEVVQLAELLRAALKSRSNSRSETFAFETGSRPANRPSLFFQGLNLGDRSFDRLESLFGEVGIEFARFRHIPNEPVETRPGIFGLNLKNVLE
jgi:hypothetical protein